MPLNLFLLAQVADHSVQRWWQGRLAASRVPLTSSPGPFLYRRVLQNPSYCDLQ